MLSIYSYSEPHQFLKDQWKLRNKRNPNFSLRSWAKKMGLANTAPLSLMLSGKRPIAKKYIPHFVKDLELSKQEAQYLEALVDCDRAKSLEGKTHYLNRLKELSPRKQLQMHELEGFRFLEDPLHTVILEMTDLPDFKPEAAWIQNRLAFPRQRREIREALDRLVGLGLLLPDENSKLRKAHAHISSTNDIKNEAVQTYHRNICSLAAERVGIDDPALREFSSFSLNIKKSSIPGAKQAIRDFVDQFINNYEAKPEEGDETYQFNVQLFGVTKFN